MRCRPEREDPCLSGAHATTLVGLNRAVATDGSDTDANDPPAASVPQVADRPAGPKRLRTGRERVLLRVRAGPHSNRGGNEMSIGISTRSRRVATIVIVAISCPA